ncbi:MAG TPA: thioredoxin family protein [Candidatus Sulfomarinibacteraceae bacterium]|nr:thioredoxin family protein [Candidatus Sulfomarinibacteraceae bacterium]
MKKIVVLGPGCPRCETLANLTRQAADQLGIAYQLDKLTDIKQFAGYGLMMTPGLVVDGQLKVQGKVPSLDELKAMLTGGAA